MSCFSLNNGFTGQPARGTNQKTLNNNLTDLIDLMTFSDTEEDAKPETKGSTAFDYGLDLTIQQATEIIKKLNIRQSIFNNNNKNNHQSTLNNTLLTTQSFGTAIKEACNPKVSNNNNKSNLFGTNYQFAPPGLEPQEPFHILHKNEQNVQHQQSNPGLLKTVSDAASVSSSFGEQQQQQKFPEPISPSSSNFSGQSSSVSHSLSSIWSSDSKDEDQILNQFGKNQIIKFKDNTSDFSSSYDSACTSKLNQFLIQSINYNATSDLVNPFAKSNSYSIRKQASISGSKSTANEREPPANGRLHVSNIPFKYRREHLIQLFQSFGEVFDAEVIFNERGSKGFGFVSFYKSEHANNARQSMDGRIIEGRKIEVNTATPKPMKQTSNNSRVRKQNCRS